LEFAKKERNLLDWRLLIQAKEKNSKKFIIGYGHRIEKHSKEKACEQRKNAIHSTSLSHSWNDVGSELHLISQVSLIAGGKGKKILGTIYTNCFFFFFVSKHCFIPSFFLQTLDETYDFMLQEKRWGDHQYRIVNRCRSP
jgi:hypothetical protein